MTNLSTQTLKREIHRLAKEEYPCWVNGGRFERQAMDLQYKPSNASRRCRELVTEGVFERRLNESRCVEYRYIPPKVLTIEEKKEESEFLLRSALL